jgi:hypothetical protein
VRGGTEDRTSVLIIGLAAADNGGASIGNRLRDQVSLMATHTVHQHQHHDVFESPVSTGVLLAVTLAVLTLLAVVASGLTG